MSVITTRLTVAADGTISVADPLATGQYVIEVRAIPLVTPPSRPLRIEDFPKYDMSPIGDWPTFSRDEMYGDDGR